MKDISTMSLKESETELECLLNTWLDGDYIEGQRYRDLQDRITELKLQEVTHGRASNESFDTRGGHAYRYR